MFFPKFRARTGMETKPMRKHWWMALLLAVCAGSAIAGGPGAVRQQVEASLLVTGTIDITADGRVAAYTVDHADALSTGIVKFIGRAVPNWRFEPIQLKNGATRARAKMTIRLVGHKLNDEQVSIRIAAASFAQEQAPARMLQSDSLGPPRYPSEALRRGITGTVYVVVKVGRDGKVDDAVIERVNLRVIDSSRRMANWRNLLADAVLRAAREWSFVAPSQGDDVDAPFWSARVPVDFRVDDDNGPDYGEWEAYVPGPRHNIPWVDDDLANGSDALIAGRVYPLDSSLRLLTPLEPST